jgi:CRISPR-associated protein Cmr2
MSEPLYTWKACALLLPSPFVWADPAGEAARRAELVTWLQSAGVDVDAVDRDHLERCAYEAHDALVPLQQEPPSPQRSQASDIPPMRHPLSAQSLLGQVRAQDAARLHADLLAELQKLNGPPDGRWYRHLWRTVMRHPSYRDVPADARLPDHTVAAHRSLTAALTGATLGGDRPALLALHVGPVQGFIQAARRTHDLWIASYTIGFLAFAAARKLAEELGPDVLVHPDISERTLADQLVFEQPLRPAERPVLLRAALVNRILAVLPDRRADALAHRCAEAVAETWRAMATATKQRLGFDRAPQTASGFDEQIEAHLDLDLVVQPWPGRNAEIASLLDAARLPREPWLDEPVDHPGAACGALIDLTERTLAAHRRALAPLGAEGDQRPKCTSCGLREQMGPIDDKPWQQQIASRTFFEQLSKQIEREDPARGSLQLVPGEGLCAVCLTKRFAPEVYYGAARSGLGLAWKDGEGDRRLLRFPSTATVASAPLRLYLQQVSGRSRRAIEDWLDRLHELHHKDLLNFTPPGNLLGGLGALGDPSRLLAHEGTWLYESTYEPDVVWRNHFTVEPTQDQDQRDRHARIAGVVRRARVAFAGARRAIDGKGKAASPYYAVIVLDGDEFGEWRAGRHRHSPTIGELSAGEPPAGVSSDLRRPVHPALYGELSRRVALLGDDLHKIIDRHLGRLVYYGGDDLLALVPLATALPCLDAIRQSIQLPRHLGARVTVSAGVAVSHWRDPLASALAAARLAEKKAKQAGRDRFAIYADKRSGETLKIVLPWTLASRDVIPTLGGMLTRGAGEEPPLADAKAAYQLREELPALGHAELQDAFLHRVVTLVFGVRGGRARRDQARGRGEDAYALLQALLSDVHQKFTHQEFADRAAGVVDLLLFLRFLLREEHGIETEQLLRGLPAKEDKP